MPLSPEIAAMLLFVLLEFRLIRNRFRVNQSNPSDSLDKNSGLKQYYQIIAPIHRLNQLFRKYCLKAQC